MISFDYMKSAVHEKDRWQMILGAIKGRPVVTVHELIVLTGTSPATLRRDLAKLEELGQIRSHTH